MCHSSVEGPRPDNRAGLRWRKKPEHERLPQNVQRGDNTTESTGLNLKESVEQLDKRHEC